MGKVFRCFVEKKPGFDVEAGHLLSELTGTLGVSGLSGVRVIRRYDVEGLEQAGYEAGVCFLVQMEGMRWVEPNDRTHPEFGAALREAHISCGVDSDRSRSHLRD